MTLVMKGSGVRVPASALRSGPANVRNLARPDLRHTFATTMIGRTSVRRVQEWMGHSDLHSTMRYLHDAPREDDAELVAEAFM
jgi:integrase